MELIAQRTTLRPGAAARYCEVHSRVPDPVEAALRAAGVVRWHIWRDGDLLFHTIETTRGRDAMQAEMARLGPIDEEWDALIRSLVDFSPSAQAILEPVWEMNPAGQSDGKARPAV